jgi:hypothetical protein
MGLYSLSHISSFSLFTHSFLDSIGVQQHIKLHFCPIIHVPRKAREGSMFCSKCISDASLEEVRQHTKELKAKEREDTKALKAETVLVLSMWLSSPPFFSFTLL